jgi:MFS family permease
VLCGFAWSMASLIGFRLLQGLGAGAIQPVTMTIIGDLYKLEQRGRVQGMMASVWATSAVLGPLAGGIIVDNMSWAWIFWINLPFGALTVIGLLLFLRETVAPRRARIDYLGAALFSVAITALLITVTETGADAPVLAALGLLFVVSGVLFVLQERRAAEPIISIALWTRRLIATSNAATLLAGMALIGLTTVLPIYIQGVLGRSPIVAGFALSMLVLGWPLAVMLSGRLYRAFGVRRTLRAGSMLFPIGALILLLLTQHSHPALAGAASFLMGVGMGLISVTSIALVQESVEWSMRGSATASVVFARSLGNTIGATALGAVLNLGIAHYGSGELAARVHAVLNEPMGLAELAADPAVRAVFDQALRWTFLVVAALAILTCAVIWMIPVVRRQDAAPDQGRPADAASR